MRKVLAYDIEKIVPYVNWVYFYFAWGIHDKPRAEKELMREEAMAMLRSWQGKYHTHAVFRLFQAYGDRDDLLLDGVRMPLLRQQCPSREGAPCLCLADFVRPLSSGIPDTVGAFCTSVDASIAERYKEDAYQAMMAQVLCDRLAEGTAERMHEEVRRKYWGYAPDEELMMEQTHKEDYQGIRPAIGYPSLPDTSINFILSDLLDMREIHVRLTSSGMMMPHASVSGLMFAHPAARYFELGKIGEDQLRDYARRRGLPTEAMRKFLQSSLMRK